MKAELSWYVHNCDLINLPEMKWEQNTFSQDLDYELISQLWNAPLMVPKPINGNGQVA